MKVKRKKKELKFRWYPGGIASPTSNIYLLEDGIEVCWLIDVPDHRVETIVNALNQESTPDVIQVELTVEEAQEVIEDGRVLRSSLRRELTR